MSNGGVPPAQRGDRSLSSSQTEVKTNRSGTASNLPSSGKELAAFLLNVGVAVVMTIISLPGGIIHGIIHARETKKTDTLKAKICVALWNDPRASQFKKTFNNDLSNFAAFLNVLLAEGTEEELKGTLTNEESLTDLIGVLSLVTDVKGAIAQIQETRGAK